MDDTLKTLQNLIKDAPNKAEHHLNYGLALFELDRTNDAIISYRTAISLNPKLGAAHINLGLALSYLDQDEEAITALRFGIDLLPNHIEGLFTLARCLRAEEDYENAAITFKKALSLAPSRTKIYWELGYSLELSGDKSGGLEAYNTCLRHHPDHSVARHLRDALIGNTTATAPPDYVEELFDDYAPNFDEYLTKELAYAVPKLLRATLEELNISKSINSALDLGGGTGLVATEIRNFLDSKTSVIHGVDLSAGMIDIAHQHNRYDKTFNMEINEFLKSPFYGLPEYDLITAGDVFVYIGNLENTFQGAHKRLKDHGLFLFTVEQSVNEKFLLQPSARYAHSKNYITELANKTKFKILKFKKIIPRQENNENVQGYLICLQK